MFMYNRLFYVTFLVRYTYVHNTIAIAISISRSRQIVSEECICNSVHLLFERRQHSPDPFLRPSEMLSSDIAVASNLLPFSDALAKLERF